MNLSRAIAAGFGIVIALITIKLIFDHDPYYILTALASGFDITAAAWNGTTSKSV